MNDLERQIRVKSQRMVLRPEKKPDSIWDYYPCDWCWDLSGADDMHATYTDDLICDDCARALYDE